jgi:hypothetical protein
MVAGANRCENGGRPDLFGDTNRARRLNGEQVLSRHRGLGGASLASRALAAVVLGWGSQLILLLQESLSVLHDKQDSWDKYNMFQNICQVLRKLSSLV